MSTKSRVIALLIVAPLLFLAGALGTGFAWILDALSQYNEASATAAQYGVAFVIGASGAIALLVVSRRSERTRLRRAGTITGAILTGLAVLVSGLPFAFSIGGLVHDAVRSAQPQTEEETTSIAELRMQARGFLGQSMSTFGEMDRVDEDPLTGTQPCQLSNLERGEQLAALETYYLTSASRDATLEALETQWESLGYDVTRDDDGLYIGGGNWLDTASAYWVSDPESGEATLSISLISICVVADQ